MLVHAVLDLDLVPSASSSAASASASASAAARGAGEPSTTTATATPTLPAAEDRGFLKVYLEFLENLVSAHAFYTTHALRKLVDQLLIPVSPSSDFHPRIHMTIRNILALVPSASTSLIPLLSENFPHKRESVALHERYVHHLVQIIQYAPLTREPIIEIMMDRALQIDVEITVDMDDLDDEDEDILAALKAEQEEQEQQEQEEREEFAGSNAFDEHADGDDDEDRAAEEIMDEDDELAPMEEDRRQALVRMKEMMAKLDTVLTTTFRFCQSMAKLESSSGSRGSWSQQQQQYAASAAASPALHSLFMTMLSVFDRSILRTHKAKYTQTLLFYLGSLHESFPDTLLGLLLTRTFDTSLATYLRCTSSAYLASYLARAKYLPPTTLAHCLKLCTQWAHRHLDRTERKANTKATTTTTGTGPNPRKYPVFYSVVQTILYVFCFRWRELVGLEEVFEKEEESFGMESAGNGNGLLLLQQQQHQHQHQHQQQSWEESTHHLSSDGRRGSLTAVDCTQGGIGFSAGSHDIGFAGPGGGGGGGGPPPQALDTEWRGGGGTRASASSGGIHGRCMEWWHLRGGFQRIIYSRLNPLKVCARNVVREFDAIAQELQLVYCSSLIFANKRTPMPPPWTPPTSACPSMMMMMTTATTTTTTATTTTTTPTTGTHMSSWSETASTADTSCLSESQQANSGKTIHVTLEEIIESFFPFDPFYSHLSFREDVQDLYIGWRGLNDDANNNDDDAGDDDGDDDNDYSDDDDNDAAAVEDSECETAEDDQQSAGPTDDDDDGDTTHAAEDEEEEH